MRCLVDSRGGKLQKEVWTRIGNAVDQSTVSYPLPPSLSIVDSPGELFYTAHLRCQMSLI